MKHLTMTKIRELYLNFFKERGHEHLPSSPLIPYNDPTVLLTTAGMLQFKPIMFGTEKPTYGRVTTSQKCFRTTDLENVGFTPRHHTFFEMLGNFSFGDYYKDEVIPWAWEFITEVLELPKDKLFISVFESDDEAYEIWTKKVGVSESHMARLGERDNFWAAGETGPCGPCSEIYFDLGESMGNLPFKEDVLNDGNRFLEFWNLVFMEFNRHPDGSLTPLPNKNIDTGMGLERITSIIQGKTTNYEIDLLQEIIQQVEPLASPEGQEHPQYKTALQVIADHSRASVMLIGDGVTPSNEGRGYVLRRILRRAVRFGHLIGIKEPFLHTLLPTITGLYPVYPELTEKQALIEETVRIEEERFGKTLSRGMKKLNDALDTLEGKVIPGLTAFELYDTYGFPLELTQEIAEEQGLKVDVEGYQEEMNKQVERARAATRSNLDIGAGVIGFEPTTFLGYQGTSAEATVQGLLDTHEPHLKRLILDQTPFYAESGGQVSDHGQIEAGAHAYEVVDVQKVGEVIVHVLQGEDWQALNTGDTVRCKVAQFIRQETMKHHSVTHLMHQALKDVLGDQVKQAGSEVSHYQTRFDFTFNRAMTRSEIQEVEDLVNAKIMANDPVETQVMPIDEAKNSGAVAMFGEKYGDVVRVVSMGAFSKEFCGGTHVPATGTIGSFKIVNEESIASGTRRITGIAGQEAIKYARKNETLLRDMSQALKVGFEEVPKRLEKMQITLKEQERELKNLKQQIAVQQVQGLKSAFEQSGDIHYLVSHLDVPDMNGLKQIAEELKVTHDQSLVVLTAIMNGKVSLITACSDALVSNGYKAGQVIRELAPIVGAKGGGKPAFAQAGGGDQPDKISGLKSKVQALLS